MVVLAALLAGLLAGAQPVVAADERLVMIVHPQRAEQLTRNDVARIFLRKRRTWSDGQPIVPLNHAAGSTIREQFSRLVFGTNEERFVRYWNERYFQGVLPPSTLASAAAVRRYVAADRNAIGYIRSDQVDDSVRVVLAFDD